MDYKELFIDKDDVLLIRKELVRVLGDLNEAVILNQLNYWIEINKKADKNLHDEKYWVFNTYQTWKETDFDFWSTDTIRRTLTRLENKGIVLTANYNKLKIDKTKWYTIDYKRLQKLIDEHEGKQIANKENADCGHDMANCTDGNGSISKAIPENTSDNTNRDYNTENTPNSFSNEKDNSKPNGLELYNSQVGELGTDAPEPEETDSQKSNITMTLGKRERPSRKHELQDMHTRAKEIAYRLTEDEKLSDKAFDCMKYFIDRYKANTRREHVNLRNDTLERVVTTMLSTITVPVDGKDGDYFENDYSPLICHEVDRDDFEQVIDKYFATEFSEKTDYSIVHFLNENVLPKIMNKCSIGDGYNWYESHEPY